MTDFGVCATCGAKVPLDMLAAHIIEHDTELTTAAVREAPVVDKTNPRDETRQRLMDTAVGVLSSRVEAGEQPKGHEYIAAGIDAALDWLDAILADPDTIERAAKAIIVAESHDRAAGGYTKARAALAAIIPKGEQP